MFELKASGGATVAAAAVDRPSGLLTAIAVICAVGSSIAIARAIITYRMFRNN